MAQISEKEKFEKLTHLLVPAGEGVFTVNTAKERKEALQNLLYQKSDITQSWYQAVDNSLTQASKITLLGVCSDSGGGILRGANWGPLFVRLELYQNNPQLIELISDIGDIRVIPHLLHDKYLNAETIHSCQQALYGETNNGKKSHYPVAPLSLTEEVCREIYQTQSDAKVFAIGGDHSVSYPLTKAYFENAKRKGKKVGLIHFDAHTDLLENRLGIDLCFATWTTHILHLLDSPDLVHQIGIRSSGKDKAHWESSYGIHQHWASEVKNQGAETVIDYIIKDLKEKNVEEIYISFDIDAIDATYASATGTPEPDGLMPHEAALMIKKLAQNFAITGADMVEVSPFLKTEFSSAGEDSTVQVASSLSALMIEAMANHDGNH